MRIKCEIVSIGSLSISLMLYLLLLSSSAAGGVLGDPERGSIDRRLAGAWRLVEQSNVIASERVPPAIIAVYIHDNGRVEGVGVDAAWSVFFHGTW